MTDNPERLNDELGFLDVTITVEDPAFGSLFPILQWVNGAKNRKKEGGIAYTGGFFISAEQNVVPPGFEPFKLMTSSGEEVDGFAARDIDVAIVRMRKSWSVDRPGGTGLPMRFAQVEYEDAQLVGKPSGNTHILLVINGMEEPLCLSVKGHVAKALASAGMGNNRGLIPAFATKVVNAATRLAKSRGKGHVYPLCAFFLKIGPKRDEKGAPIFDMVGTDQKSPVTLPVWLDDPAAVDEPLLAERFVGYKYLGLLQEIHTDAQTWVDAWSEDSLLEQRGRRTRRAKKEEPETPAEGSDLPDPKKMPF